MMKNTLSGTAINFSASSAASATDAALGDLPTWKLQDLYPSATSTAFTGDMEKAGKQAIAFEEKWKGKLADAATKTGTEGIGQALKEYEALDDIIGRLGSFTGLTYFSDTSNPVNGKLYGDAQAKVTEFSSHLLFFRSNSIGSTTPSSMPAWLMTRMPATIARGSSICARTSHISSRTSWSSSSWKSR